MVTPERSPLPWLMKENCCRLLDLFPCYLLLLFQVLHIKYVEAETLSIWIQLWRVRAQRYRFSGPNNLSHFVQCLKQAVDMSRADSGSTSLCLKLFKKRDLANCLMRIVPYFNFYLRLHTKPTRKEHKPTYSTDPKLTCEEFCFRFIYTFLAVIYFHYWPIFGSWSEKLALKSTEIGCSSLTENDLARLQF